MARILMYGRTTKGTMSFIVEEATWRTVASIADGLQGCALDPITWTAREIPVGQSLHEALAASGLLDEPMALVA